MRTFAFLQPLLLGSASGAAIRALDGSGRPVAWWAVLKLPAHVRGPATDPPHAVPTPCDCPVPDCRHVPTDGWAALKERATGLCYLYADARDPTFRYFRDIGYECLGQGGADPVSRTLQQRDAASRPYWALFNDQFNGIAAAFAAAEADDSAESHVCGGADAFSAHAKGAVVFARDASGGVFLQTSTPNFPDPTRNDSFVPLGCQRDNNVAFAQHVAAFSLDDRELTTLGEHLQLARLCSGNVFRNKSLHALLGSATLYEDGVTHANTSAAAFYGALLDPHLPERESMKAAFRLKLARGIDDDDDDDDEQPETVRRVFEPLAEDQTLMGLVDDDDDRADREAGDEDEEVLVLVKSPRAVVPPWALVAELLDSDVSVASWWDGSYGIPTICGGDVFAHSPHSFCLDDPPAGVALDADGSAPYNIENLMQATWHLSDGSANLTWQLVGGRVPDGNHAKWGLTTPRSGIVNASNAYVTFGDLNMEGFPCSRTCSGSQAGRGGSFFSLMRPRLHASLARSIVSGACPCTSSSAAVTAVHQDANAMSDGFLRNDSSFLLYETLRMCHRGCVKKLEAHLEATELPALSATASSFWLK